MKAFRVRHRWHRASSLLLVVCRIVGRLRRTITPPVVTTPRYPDYIFPTFQPDPKRLTYSGIMTRRGAGFRQAISRRQKPGFGGVEALAEFYPSETALGYLDLARNNSSRRPAFDGCCNPGQLPAGHRRAGRSAAGGSREPEALAAFESALKSILNCRPSRGAWKCYARVRAGERRGRPQGCAGESARRSGPVVRAGDRRFA